tara:strand:- start:23 stop:199 length:177 start_codon:yes stop_codon:yes gene_type:complete
MDNESAELVKEHIVNIEAVRSELEQKLDELKAAKDHLESELKRLGAAHKVLSDSLPEA